MPSLSQHIQNINQSTFKLDSVGVVGLFGGDRAADALETIHLYAGRRWAGWYNYPGGVTVAMRFGQVATSRFWDTIFPGPKISAAATFNLAGKPGPDYFGVFFGTLLHTKYPGHLIADTVADSRSTWPQLFKRDGSPARSSSPAKVAFISLSRPRRMQRVWTLLLSGLLGVDIALWSIVPSMASILACILCFVGRDPLCGSLVLSGILAGGFFSLVLGCATLRIRVPASQTTPSSGDGPGLMFLEDGSIIILQGKEREVDLITRGEFNLEYPRCIAGKHGHHHLIGITSLLLVAHVFAQFILLPRCTFFGQIMTLISFLTSGLYHLYVVSRFKTKKLLHWAMLRQEIRTAWERWSLATTAQMAVFVCLVIGESEGNANPSRLDPIVILRRIIPNETGVWDYWRRNVAEELVLFWQWAASADSESSPARPYKPTIQPMPVPDPKTEQDDHSHSGFTEDDRQHLNLLIVDARCVFSEYSRSPVRMRIAELLSTATRDDSEHDQIHVSSMTASAMHSLFLILSWISVPVFNTLLPFVVFLMSALGQAWSDLNAR